MPSQLFNLKVLIQNNILDYLTLFLPTDVLNVIQKRSFF